MSVEAKNISFHGSANMQEDDTSTPQGGAIDKSIKITFEDVASAGIVAVVAEDSTDTSIQITVYGRDSSGALVSEAISTNASNGTTETNGSQSFERILKAVVATSSPTGALAVLCSQGQVTGTATGGGNDYIDLEAGDQQADNYYKGWVVKPTAGSAANQLRECVKYDGTLNRVYVRDWDGGGASNPASSDTYKLAPGVVFEYSGQIGTAVTVTEVRRPFYNIAADPSSDKDFYEKIFVFNGNSTYTLSNATLTEDSSVGNATLRGNIEFAVEDALDDTGTTTNRVTAPASGFGSFGNGPIDFPNSKNFTNGTGLGIMLHADLAAGDSAQNDEYGLVVAGQTT